MEIGFETPWALLLLVVIPITWWIGRRSLAGLGPWRRSLALVFRSLVLLLIVLAIAGVQWIWSSDRLTVIYLLDQSDSIPIAKRQLMLDYAIESVKKHRRTNRNDRAGLIIFGREASIELPPLDEDLPNISRPEANVGRTDATNLESALKLAQASFLEDSSKRIVILTDGNQTLGSAESTAQRLAENGIGIDVVPIRLDSNTEILVEKIDIPGFVREGQTVDARVVINRYNESGKDEPIDGRLKVVRRIGNQTEVLADAPYQLDRDTNVIPIPHKIETNAGFVYEAEFIPDDKSSDTIPQNNKATAFTYARGKGRVMLIEDANRPGEYQSLIESLRRNDLEVDARTTSTMFTSLIELQSYDAVILAGTPRTTGDESTQVVAFSDDQVNMLVQSVQQFGMGIVMIGGPEAFGAGGWTNSKLEEAMPVNFAIKNSKIEAVGALAMVMHASEMERGNYWQKMIGKAALDALGPQDYCGVVQYDMSGDKWLWGEKTGMLKVGENRSAMRTKINNMIPGDMPNFDSSLSMALASLKTVPASLKHMIVISDGDPAQASNSVLSGYASAQIKISTVAVGTHGPAGHAELKRIANKTGGNYYVVTNPNALPRIFMREARRVAKPLVYEPEGGVTPYVQSPHEILSGLPRNLPPISGFVFTELKESPLVEVPILSPKPDEKENASILATWTYGLGRTAVVSTDAGHRWAKDWVDSGFYDQFYSQLVRWVMRPSADDGKYSIATNMKDGRVQIVVTALDSEDGFLNYLDMGAIAVGPDLQPVNVAMKQTAPGRYVGEMVPDQAGSYMLSVIPGPNKPPITTGITIPFSDEYRVRQANMRLLRQLAENKPVGGEGGLLEESLETESMERIVQMDTYRPGLPPAKSLKDVWPFAVAIGATFFFADVFVRRVAVDLIQPIQKLASRFSGKEIREVDLQRAKSLERLRSSKSGVAENMNRQIANTTFSETTFDSESSSAKDLFNPSSPKSPSNNAPSASAPSMQPEEETSYTSRLLEAKRKAKKQP
jgi:uncharacterized membrane protein